MSSPSSPQLWERIQKTEPDVPEFRTSQPARLSYWIWLGIGLLLVIQWLLFRQYALREVVWAYPTVFDQASYLNQVYQAYENILSRGLFPGLLDIIRAPVANGIMLQLQASLFFLFTGASRLSALTLNFLYFAFLQCALVATLYSITRRWSIALLGEGLLLTAITPFFWVGGIMDFRIDFIALCLFGVMFALIMWSGIFISRPVSCAVGGIAAVLILFRFIMMIYIFGIFGICLLYFCGNIWLHNQRQSTGKQATKQLYNLVISGLIINAIVLPVLWHNRYELYRYYVVGHVIGSEPEIRARQVGAVKPLDVLLFYPRSVLIDHAGTIFLVVSGMLLLIGMLVFFSTRNKRTLQAKDSRFDVVAAYICIGACIIVPYTVLTIDVAKSPVVGNILLHPILWFVILTFFLLSRKLDGRRTIGRHLLLGISVFVFTFGVYNQLNHYSRHSLLTMNHSDVEQIEELNNTLFQYSEQLGLKDPTISADRILEYFNIPVFRVMMYEARGRFFKANWGLGSRIFAIDEAQIPDILNKSDFLLVTPSTIPESQVYPFDIQMERLRPQLLALCNDAFFPLKHFSIYRRDVTLCVRPQLTIQGDSAGWITDKGLILRGVSQVLRDRPTIEISGLTKFAYLSKVPTVTAELVLQNKASKPISATLERSAGNADAYLIRVHVSPNDLQDDEPVQIHLAFDTYFVPNEIGLNSDMRRLVIRVPTKITLTR